MAGVATNVLIALLIVPLIVGIGLLGQYLPGLVRPLGVLQQMLAYGVSVNLFLAMFNLLPIPPLDGSHVFKYLLPPQWALQYQRLGMYGLFVLIGFLWVGQPLLNIWLAPAKILFALTAQLYFPYLLPNPFA
jgi:Zn-dependent protease